MSVVLSVLLMVCSLYRWTEAAQSVHWSYEGMYDPSNWTHLYAECGKNRQSPINIDTSTTVFDDQLDPILLTVNNDPNMHGERQVVVNNGHTVNLAQVAPTIRVTGGKLGSTYRVAGVHFHWGKTDATGSEHTVNGNHYPLEMHVVSYNEGRYDALKDAVKAPDGLAVIGLLFQVSSEDNVQLQPIINILSQLNPPEHTSVNLTNFDITKLLPSVLSDYYRYLGSLTTPPCYESVTWTVLRQISNVSLAQLNVFRSALEQHAHGDDHGAHAAPIDQNWRPVQPIYYRSVTRSFDAKKPPTVIVKDQQPSANSSASRNYFATIFVVLAACFWL